MKQHVFQEKYPVFELCLLKSETTKRNADEIIAALREKVEAHPKAHFIALFDHYAHTASLPDGEIAADIRDAKHIVFCFGFKLPNAGVMAVRPRSIGVTEYDDRFIINFMEPPMPMATEAMESWVKALADR